LAAIPSNKLLILCSPISERLEYIVAQLFRGQAVLTIDTIIFSAHQGPRINYTDHPILLDEVVWVMPVGLLLEKGIRQHSIKVENWKGLPIFFVSDGSFPFDIFSAAFFLLSRYEEYLPAEKDQYDRFDYTQSIAFKENFLQIPLVNVWVQQLLAAVHPSGNLENPFLNHSFRFVPTYDIDIAFKYRDQPFWKNLAGFFQQLLLGNFEAVSEKAMVYSNRSKDPFDIYAWLDGLHKKYAMSPIYFFLLAKKRQGVDKNISPAKKDFKNFIAALASQNQTGIHPSWQSGDDATLLRQEINLLAQFSSNEVTRSRQHYLRMQLPYTYRQLMVAGIQEEYSMGYGTSNGFRASYAMPYYWYDLNLEKQTHLLLHPFCYMDSTAIFHERLSPAEALASLKAYQTQVSLVKGEMVTIFHNHLLAEEEGWKDWRNVYEQFLAFLQPTR
jgi:hypothetical protein